MSSFFNRFSHNALYYLTVIFAFLTPLFFLTITSEYFITNKTILITSIGSFSLISWCVYQLSKKSLSVTISPGIFPLLLLVISLLVSSLWISPIKIQSLTNNFSVYFAFFAIFLTATSVHKTIKLPKTIFSALISSAVILNLFTFLHYFDLTKNWLNDPLFNNKLFNPSGSIVSAIAITIPLLIGNTIYLISSKKWSEKAPLIIANIIMISGCLINISHLLPNDNDPFIFLPYRASWAITMDIFKYWKSALFGTGPETYFSTFTRLRPTYLNLNPTLWNIRFTESSSYMLTLVTTSGILGGLGFLFTFIQPLISNTKTLDNNQETPLARFYIFSLIGVFLTFIFLPLGLSSLSVAISLLIGLTLINKQFNQSNVKEYTFSLSTTNDQTTLATSFLPWLATIFSITIISLYSYFEIPSYKASILIKQAAKLINTDITGSFLKQTSASENNPNDPNYQIILSQTYQNVAKYYLNKEDLADNDRQNVVETMQRAINSGKLAVKINPYNVVAWENLANIYSSFIGVADGASDLAISHLAQAISLDPTNPRLRLQLGILYANLNDYDQATKLINQSIDLKQNWNLPYLNMASLYKNRQDNTKTVQFLKTGLSFTDPKSEDYEKIQAEIKSLEKITNQVGTSSAVPK